MNLEIERELFLRHSHFEFLMQYVDWDGKSWVFKESNSLQDTQNYYKDYLHFVDCWSYWLASINRQGYVLVPVEPNQKMIEAAIIEKQKHGRTDSDLYKAMIGAVE